MVREASRTFNPRERVRGAACTPRRALRPRLLSLLLLTASCAPNISETRMVFAPARESNCALELIHVDMMSVSFQQQWDLLGHVTLGDTGPRPDPASEENRALVRPRACSMGGTAVAVVASTTNRTPLGKQGNALVYIVLRPKSAASAPSKF